MDTTKLINIAAAIRLEMARLESNVGEEPIHTPCAYEVLSEDRRFVTSIDELEKEIATAMNVLLGTQLVENTKHNRSKIKHTIGDIITSFVEAGRLPQYVPRDMYKLVVFETAIDIVPNEESAPIL